MFLSPQLIIINKHGIYELPHKLPGNIKKIWKFYGIIAWCSVFIQNENLVNASKRLLNNRNETFPLVRYFTWKLQFVSNILFMIVGKYFFSWKFPRIFSCIVFPWPDTPLTMNIGRWDFRIQKRVRSKYRSVTRHYLILFGS